jgi:hypothetical protein
LKQESLGFEAPGKVTNDMGWVLTRWDNQGNPIEIGRRAERGKKKGVVSQTPTIKGQTKSSADGINRKL